MTREQSQTIGTNHRAGNQIGHNRAPAETARQRHDNPRRSQHDQRIAIARHIKPCRHLASGKHIRC